MESHEAWNLRDAEDMPSDLVNVWRKSPVRKRGIGAREFCLAYLLLHTPFTSRRKQWTLAEILQFQADELDYPETVARPQIGLRERIHRCIDALKLDKKAPPRAHSIDPFLLEASAHRGWQLLALGTLLDLALWGSADIDKAVDSGRVASLKRLLHLAQSTDIRDDVSRAMVLHGVERELRIVQGRAGRSERDHALLSLLYGIQESGEPGLFQLAGPSASEDGILRLVASCAARLGADPDGTMYTRIKQVVARAKRQKW